MDVAVLPIGKVGSIEVGTAVPVSSTRSKDWKDSPADDDVVVGAVYFSVPSSPALVEAGRDDCGDRAAEFWATKEREMDPGGVGAQKGEEGENRGMRAGSSGTVVVEGEVEVETVVLA